MADDPTKRGNADRSRVSGSEYHELRYFAEQHQISIEQVKALIEKHGNDRATLDAEARRLKG